MLQIIGNGEKQQTAIQICTINDDEVNWNAFSKKKKLFFEDLKVHFPNYQNKLGQIKKMYCDFEAILRKSCTLFKKIVARAGPESWNILLTLLWSYKKKF